MSTALRWFAPVALIAPAFPAVLAAQQQQLPPMPVPPENPQTAEKIVLGKILFFEEQLASDRRVACATCHTSPAGGGDRRFARHPGSDNRFVTPDDVHGSPGLRALDSARVRR